MMMAIHPIITGTSLKVYLRETFEALAIEKHISSLDLLTLRHTKISDHNISDLRFYSNSPNSIDFRISSAELATPTFFNMLIL